MVSEIEDLKSFVAAMGNAKPTGIYFLCDNEGNSPLLDAMRDAKGNKPETSEIHISYAGYRMLSVEDIEGMKAHGWSEVEIAEAELWLWNNSLRGASMQMNDAWKALFKPVFEPIIKAMTAAYYKIGKKK